MFKAGKASLIAGLVVRTDSLVMCTTIPDSKSSCCSKITPDKLASELLYSFEFDIRTIGTFRVPIAPPPQAITSTEKSIFHLGKTDEAAFQRKRRRRLNENAAATDENVDSLSVAPCNTFREIGSIDDNISRSKDSNATA